MNAPRYFPVDYETAYRARPPWDIGRPQPALAELAAQARGAVLDVGCGTGEHALFYAARGHEAWGLDQVPLAIEKARAKAAERGLSATFRVGDALALGELGRRFDLIVDSGLFHVFGDAERARYVESLRAALNPGGAVHLLCFSERTPGTLGPRRVTEAELRAAFAEGWTVRELVPAAFAANRPDTPQGWRAVLERDREPAAAPAPAPAGGSALARELREEIEAVAARASLREEVNFLARADALDRIEFHVVDRLRACEATPELAALERRAAEVTEALAQVDQRLFDRLRAAIAGRALRGEPLRRELLRHLGGGVPAASGYDQLDLFIAGLLRLEAMPPLALRPREPEMVYYQPTPARVVLEMLWLAGLGPGGVFYDLGSGLGQVCILAGLLTGARAVGVEFEPTYCDYARESARRLGLEGVEFVNADARSADYGDGTVFFMYTPFRGAMMESVLGRVEQATRGRAVRVCTFGTCAEQVGRQPWLRRVAQQGEGPDALALFER